MNDQDFDITTISPGDLDILALKTALDIKKKFAQSDKGKKQQHPIEAHNNNNNNNNANNNEAATDDINNNQVTLSDGKDSWSEVKYFY